MIGFELFDNCTFIFNLLFKGKEITNCAEALRWNQVNGTAAIKMKFQNEFKGVLISNLRWKMLGIIFFLYP